MTVHKYLMPIFVLLLQRLLKELFLCVLYLTILFSFLLPVCWMALFCSSCENVHLESGTSLKNDNSFKKPKNL